MIWHWLTCVSIFLCNYFIPFQDEKKKKIHDLLRKRLGEATSLSHSSISRSESCTNPDNSLVQNTIENVVENANETGEVSEKPFNHKQTKSIIDVPRKAKMIIPKVYIYSLNSSRSNRFLLRKESCFLKLIFQILWL